MPKNVTEVTPKELTEEEKKKADQLLAEELLRKQRLAAVNVEANLLIPANEQLLGEAIVEAREQYLYASKQKDRDPAKTRYLLARMIALCAAREVLYPEK